MTFKGTINDGYTFNISIERKISFLSTVITFAGVPAVLLLEMERISSKSRLREYRLGSAW